MGMIGSAARQAGRLAMMGFLGVDPVRQKQLAEERAKLEAANRQAAGLFDPVPGAVRQAAIANADGGDITAAFGPVLEQGPSRQRTPMEIAQALAKLQGETRGFKAAPYVDIAAYAKPDIAIGPDGRPYDKGDPATLAQRFANPQAVNDLIVDMNDPTNRERHIPKLGEGMTYQRDASGRATGVQNAPGYVDALSQATGAKEVATQAARAPYEFIAAPVGGAPSVISKQRAMGGVFQGTRPDDAAYQSETAKFSAEQFKGIQQAGQRAGAMVGTYNRIGQLLDGYATGRFTPAGKELASAASSLGVKVDPKWGNIEAADALSKKLALDAMGGSLGAGFSNADRAFVESMNPSVMNTPQGRQKMIEFGVARAKREQQIAAMARQWQQRAGRLDAPDRSGKTFFDYLESWGEQNPITGGR